MLISRPLCTPRHRCSPHPPIHSVQSACSCDNNDGVYFDPHCPTSFALPNFLSCSHNLPLCRPVRAVAPGGCKPWPRRPIDYRRQSAKKEDHSKRAKMLPKNCGSSYFQVKVYTRGHDKTRMARCHTDYQGSRKGPVCGTKSFGCFPKPMFTAKYICEDHEAGSKKKKEGILRNETTVLKSTGTNKTQ